MGFVKEIGRNDSSVSSTTIAVTVPAGGVPVGDFVLLACCNGIGSDTVTSVTDSRGNTYQIDIQFSGGSGHRVALVSCKVTTALLQNDTITVTLSAANGSRNVYAEHWSGLASTGWFDKSATGSGTAECFATGNTGQTAQADEVLMGASCLNSKGATATPGPNYSEVAEVGGSASGNSGRTLYIERRTVAAAGAYAADGTWSVAAGHSEVIATYKLVVATTVVGKSLQAVWNVRATAGKSLQAVWNVRAAVSKSLQALWNVRVVSGPKSIQAIWNVRSRVGKSVTAQWNVRGFVGKSLQAIWNVRTGVGKSLEARWNVRAAVGKSLQVIWRVLGIERYIFPSRPSDYFEPDPVADELAGIITGERVVRSALRDPSGVFFAKVTRAEQYRLWFKIPALDPQLEFGPAPYSGARPAVGADILVSFVEGDEDKPAVLAVYP